MCNGFWSLVLSLFYIAGCPELCDIVFLTYLANCNDNYLIFMDEAVLNSIISALSLLVGLAFLICFFFLCSNGSQIRKSLDKITPIEPGEHKLREPL